MELKIDCFETADSFQQTFESCPQLFKRDFPLHQQYSQKNRDKNVEESLTILYEYRFLIDHL